MDATIPGDDGVGRREPLAAVLGNPSTYPQSRRLGRSIIRAGARSSRIFGVRGDKVRYVAVASPRTIARRALLRTYLRIAGVRR